MAARHNGLYLPLQECAVAEKAKATPAAEPPKRGRVAKRGSDWNKGFDLKKGPKVWQVTQLSARRPEEATGRAGRTLPSRQSLRLLYREMLRTTGW